ncbi:MAG: hypothetical protein ABSG63_14685 [Spirochaetia bacterium]|jgi:hypothetical protein
MGVAKRPQTGGMLMQDKKRVAQLIRDLGEIKAAVKRNNPILREIVASRFFWLLVLFYGLAIILFCLVMQYLFRRYGGYTAVPSPVKLIFWITTAAVTVATYVIRVRGILRIIHAIDPRLTFLSMLGDHNIGEFMHVAGPLMAIAAGLTVYFAQTGQPFVIVGTWGLCIGLIENQLAFTVHLPEYYILGYWCLATGVLSFFFPGPGAPLWVAICFGGGCLAYAVSTAMAKRILRAKESSDE